MGRSCNTHVEKKIQTSCWCIRAKEGDHVHCLSVDGSAVLTFRHRSFTFKF